MTNKQHHHQPHMMKQLTNREIEEIAYLRTCSLLLPNNNNYNLNRGSSNLTTSNNLNSNNVNIKMEKEEEDGSDEGLMQRVESSSRRNNSIAYDGDEIEIGVLPPSLVSLSASFFIQENICNDDECDGNVANQMRKRGSAAAARRKYTSSTTTTTTATFNVSSDDSHHNIINSSSSSSSRGSWPIGPQGAPIPLHLLLSPSSLILHNSSSNNNSSNNNNESAVSGLASSSQQLTSSRNHHQDEEEQKLSSSPSLSPLSSSRQRRQRHYVDSVSALIDAIQRLEDEEAAAAAADDDDEEETLSRRLPGQQQQQQVQLKKIPTIEELESKTLCQLVEIMLHSPTILNINEELLENDDTSSSRYSSSSSSSSSSSNNNPRQIIGRCCWENENENKNRDNNSNDNNVITVQVADNTTVDIATTTTTIANLCMFANDNQSKCRYPTIEVAKSAIDELGKSIIVNINGGNNYRRRVCQYAFKKNDIVWICRTCQVDETCVLCHDCFSHSNHEGHDVAFYHANAGGCCDCGDVDAWDRLGFCSKHGGPASGVDGASMVAPVGKADSDGWRMECGSERCDESNNSTIASTTAQTPPMTMIGSVEPAVLGCVRAIADFLVRTVQSGVQDGYRRANPLLFASAAVVDSTTASTTSSTSISKGAADSIISGYKRPQSLDDVHYEDARDVDRSMSSMMMESRHSSIPILHEVQFNPSMASKSSPSKKSSSKRDLCTNNANVAFDGNCNTFDPNAAGTSSSSTSPLNHHQAAKKACRGDEVSQEQCPARALGDLGRKEHGLFLVLHSDDIHFSPSTSNIHHSKVITALKELYSSPGGGRRGIDGVTMNADRGLESTAASFNGGRGIGGAADTIMALNHHQITLQQHFPSRLVLRPLTRNFLFRAPHVEAIFERILGIVKKQGELIVWGTQEVIAECGDITASCWRDGDPHSSSIVGAAMLNRARILTDVGLVCSIKTRKELRDEQLATALIQIIGLVALSADQFCDQVSVGISGALTPLLLNDLRLPHKLAKQWHSLLLTLLSVPRFKAAMSLTYVDSYRTVTAEYSRGVGLIEQSFYNLSVQFLNRVSYVTDLVRERNLLSILFRCLLDTMQSATIPSEGSASSSIASLDDSLMDAIHNSSTVRALSSATLDPSHTVLLHRRYSVCISDLKCILNVPGISRYFAACPFNQKGALDGTSTLDDWIETLSLAQQMDGNIWRSRATGHVETESKDWVGPFNTSISLSSLFERVLNWDSSPDCEMRYLDGVELTHYTITVGLRKWQRTNMLSQRPTSSPLSSLYLDYHLAPASLPFSTVAAAHGSPLAMVAIPLPQTAPWSFHLPLHRFVATCIRGCCHRTSDCDGISKLLDMLKEPMEAGATVAGENSSALLVRGLMEYPTIVLSRAAQIRAGLWKRNGHAMNDQTLNYSEPPFCRALADADLLLIQFALICQKLIAGQGSSKLVNLMLHRFGLFDFLGFGKAPNENVEKYRDEVNSGLYPCELNATEKAGNETSTEIVLPWTYCPAPDDPAAFFHLLDEFMRLILILITQLPSPTPHNRSDEVLEAKTRLRREVVHRLASGNKCHSELTEVAHVLSFRENALLGQENHMQERASGAALEEILSEIAVRKQKSGAPDEWVLHEEAWNEYDPAFYHLNNRDAQFCSENRPKKRSDPTTFAPRPAVAHASFQRIRRDLTADSCILAMVYRVLHAYFYHGCVDSSSSNNFSETHMYKSREKSDILLARAVHLLTLGAFAWDDTGSGSSTATNWKDMGGGDVGSVFHDKESAPKCSDWLFMAFLRDPIEVMNCEWYRGEGNTLSLLRMIRYETTVDSAMQTGAAWLVELVTKCYPNAATEMSCTESKTERQMKAGDQERKRSAAKEKALATMKAHMATFAANMGQEFEDDDWMSDDANSRPMSTEVNDIYLTPVQRTSNSEDFSSLGDPMITSFIPSPSTSLTPRTPHMPKDGSHCSTPKSLQPACTRLLEERPQCIVCGANEPKQIDTLLGDPELKLHANTLIEKDMRLQHSLAFCCYIQASTVVLGMDEEQKHVGVHISLCGHSIHKGCLDAYLKTVTSEHEDGGNRREFKCPLCQRSSNCLVPFVDVATDWLDSVALASIDEVSTSTAAETNSLETFLATSKWVTKNDTSVVWDGHCTFTAKDEGTKSLDLPMLSPRQSTKCIKSLIGAWDSILRSPRLRRLRSSSADINPTVYKVPDSKNSTNSDVLRRFMDQVSDVAYRADTRRLGEEALRNDFGEFRHYLSEKEMFNKDNRQAGKDIVDWPLCLSLSSMSESRKQELSREKLVSKMLFSIQAFTYTCCAEAAHARMLLHNASPSDQPSILIKSGIERAQLNGQLLLFPEANSADNGHQPFAGRLGKLRYLSLSLMVATSPIAKEVTQLCMSFPTLESDPFDFDVDENTSTKRAPLAYPILCGHILTHTTAVLMAVSGRARVEEGKHRIDSDCRNFMFIGLVARVCQVLLARLKQKFIGDPSWEQRVCSTIEQSMLQEVEGGRSDRQEWTEFCAKILLILLSPAKSVRRKVPTNNRPHSRSHDTDGTSISHIMHVIESVKIEAIAFLRDLSFICQILIPNIVFVHPTDQENIIDTDSTSILKHFMSLLQLDCQTKKLKSHLLQDLLKHWYSQSTNMGANQLVFPRAYRGSTWPGTYCSELRGTSIKIPSSSLPLLGNTIHAKREKNHPQILHLPKSYTDLYAELSEMRPICEHIAVCLVCGQVLDAGGKGQCTKHAFECGAGAGIYFLLQECVGIIIHGQKSAYIHSPYVDHYGEASQYRGMPLNLDLNHYRLMKGLWTGHLIREKVIAERSLVIPGFY